MRNLYSKKTIILTAVISVITASLLTAIILLKAFTPALSNVLYRAENLISENYVDDLTDEQKEKMEDYAVSAMVASLEDPYSFYFDAENYDTFEENMQEEYVGVGVSVNFDSEKNQMVVISPTDNSPAQKAGILPGDIITKVDDIKVTKDNYNDVIEHIKGNGAKKGSKVTIYVLRGEKEKVFELSRDTISIDTVSHKMLDESVGYIRISEFKHNTVDEFKEALDFIKENKAKGFVIDLRSNPGGYADSVLEMTDMLLPEGTIAYLEDSKGEKEYFKSDKNWINLPMTVLVNEGTASAAELMAGSLKAHDKAKIVGKKTYGKAVGQTPYMLTSETAIYLTNARYYTPKGECIDKKGIKPDIEVDLPDEQKVNLSSLDASNDAQLKMAVEVLYDQIS